jgi:hypothetical protein
MTVVVNLDAFWHARQTERVRQPFEQTRLGRGVGEFAAERLARIGQRMVIRSFFSPR